MTIIHLDGGGATVFRESENSYFLPGVNVIMSSKKEILHKLLSKVYFVNNEN